MIEWIVILTWVALPWNNSAFQAQVYTSRFGDRVDRVYISSDTTTFSNQWNALTVEERKNATVIKGLKYNISSELKLEKTDEMTYEEIADLSAKKTDEVFKGKVDSMTKDYNDTLKKISISFCVHDWYNVDGSHTKTFIKGYPIQKCSKCSLIRQKQRYPCGYSADYFYDDCQVNQ